MGLNATEQEERDDILRAEIVVQRDGLPSVELFLNALQKLNGVPNLLENNEKNMTGYMENNWIIL